jgi:hypothetical protein
MTGGGGDISGREEVHGGGTSRKLSARKNIEKVCP